MLAIKLFNIMYLKGNKWASFFNWYICLWLFIAEMNHFIMSIFDYFYVWGTLSTSVGNWECSEFCSSNVTQFFELFATYICPKSHSNLSIRSISDYLLVRSSFNFVESKDLEIILKWKQMSHPVIIGIHFPNADNNISHFFLLAPWRFSQPRNCFIVRSAMDRGWPVFANWKQRWKGEPV